MFATLAASSLVLGCATEAPPVAGLDQIMSAFERGLPAGWSVAKRSSNKYPRGHHDCDDYAGITGTEIVVVGPTAVNIVWTSKAGELRQSPIAKEALDVWFMPSEYRDSRTNWLCFTRRLQPIAILKTSHISVFGSPSIHFNSKEEAKREVFDQALSWDWPQSPHNDYSKLSWSTWRRDIETALRKAIPR
jgi:hypothetical protein